MAHATGSAWAFFIAMEYDRPVGCYRTDILVIPIPGSWSINTGTTIITFLMVFVIQKSQNKDSKSVQLKLNELIAANKLASNRLIVVEDLTEDELDTLHQYYCRLAEETKKRMDMKESHSVEEAIENTDEKLSAYLNEEIRVLFTRVFRLIYH